MACTKPCAPSRVPPTWGIAAEHRGGGIDLRVPLADQLGVYHKVHRPGGIENFELLFSQFAQEEFICVRLCPTTIASLPPAAVRSNDGSQRDPDNVSGHRKQSNLSSKISLGWGTSCGASQVDTFLRCC